MANNSVNGRHIEKSNADEIDNDPTTLSKKNSSNIPNEGALLTTVKEDDIFYKMDHKKQGLALIFNHQTFEDQIKHTDRDGTDIDEKSLKDCLRKLNFNVQSFKDLKAEDIRSQISVAIKMDHTHCNCFFLAVLSHGDNDVLQAYDTSYNPYEMFFDQFTAENCPTLAGKPKLFLLQSCQGTKTDPGVQLIHKPYKIETDGNDPPPDKFYSIPVYADFLIMYATNRDHYAFRNNTEGSWYVQAFCKELQSLAYEENFLTILTKINRHVALKFVSNTKDPSYDKKKQIPYFKCSLIRLLQFVDILKESGSTEWSLATTDFSTDGDNPNGRQYFLRSRKNF